MRTTLLLTTAVALAACGQNRREAAAEIAAKEAALAAGVAARAGAQAAAAVPAGSPPGMAPIPVIAVALTCADGSGHVLRVFPEQGVAVLMPDREGGELQMDAEAGRVRYAGDGLVVTAEGTTYTIARAGAAPVACTAAG